MCMNVEQAKALFPEALRDLLSFEQQGDYIIIKPHQFLGSENFSQISDIVKGKANNGEYVSAGKESHFRIPMGSTPTQEKAQTSPTTLHFKVTKLTVALGTTVQNSETEWNKQSYGLEVEVNSDIKDIVEKAKAEAEQLVQSWLTEPALPAAGIPQIDIAELDACEWQTFQKQPAKPGQVAWAKNPVEFTSWKDPPNVLLQLAKAISKSPDGKLVLGNMVYEFSGKDDLKNHFINRKPVKTETAK